MASTRLPHIAFFDTYGAFPCQESLAHHSIVSQVGRHDVRSKESTGVSEPRVVVANNVNEEMHGRGRGRGGGGPSAQGNGGDAPTGDAKGMRKDEIERVAGGSSAGSPTRSLSGRRGTAGASAAAMPASGFAAVGMRVGGERTIFSNATPKISLPSVGERRKSGGKVEEEDEDEADRDPRVAPQEEEEEEEEEEEDEEKRGKGGEADKGKGKGSSSSSSSSADHGSAPTDNHHRGEHADASTAPGEGLSQAPNVDCLHINPDPVAGGGGVMPRGGCSLHSPSLSQAMQREILGAGAGTKELEFTSAAYHPGVCYKYVGGGCWHARGMRYDGGDASKCGGDEASTADEDAGEAVALTTSPGDFPSSAGVGDWEVAGEGGSALGRKKLTALSMLRDAVLSGDPYHAAFPRRRGALLAGSSGGARMRRAIVSRVGSGGMGGVLLHGAMWELAEELAGRLEEGVVVLSSPTLVDMDAAGSRPLPPNVLHCFNALTPERVARMSSSSMLLEALAIADLATLGGGTLVPHEVELLLGRAILLSHVTFMPSNLPEGTWLSLWPSAASLATSAVSRVEQGAEIRVDASHSEYITVTVVKSRGRSFAAVDAGKEGSRGCARRWEMWVGEEGGELKTQGQRVYLWPSKGVPASVLPDIGLVVPQLQGIFQQSLMLPLDQAEAHSVSKTEVLQMRVGGSGGLTWHEFGNGTDTGEDAAEQEEKEGSEPPKKKKKKMKMKPEKSGDDGEEEDAEDATESEIGSDEKEKEGSKVEKKGGGGSKPAERKKSLKELLAEMTEKAGHQRRLLSSGLGKRALLADEDDAEKWWEAASHSEPIARAPQSTRGKAGAGEGDDGGLACAVRGREACASMHSEGLSGAELCSANGGRCSLLSFGEDQGLLGIKAAVSAPDATVVVLDGEGGGGSTEIGRVAKLMGVANLIPCARRVDQGRYTAHTLKSMPASLVAPRLVLSSSREDGETVLIHLGARQRPEPQIPSQNYLMTSRACQRRGMHYSPVPFSSRFS